MRVRGLHVINSDCTCYVKSPVGIALLQFKLSCAPLADIGKFLVEVGQVVRNTIHQYSASKCLCGTEVTHTDGQTDNQFVSQPVSQPVNQMTDRCDARLEMAVL